MKHKASCMTGRWWPWMIGLMLLVGHLSVSAQTQHSDTHHRGPSDIKQYLEQLDRPDRDAYQKPTEVVASLNVRPGMAIADLGSGSGYFTRRFVEAVKDSGTIYAIDVEPEMLAYAKESIERLRVPARVEFILADANDPKLPTNSVDLIFLCNVYHHLEDRTNYFSRVMGALKPSGRIAIVDFYHDERSGEVGFPRRHLVARETVLAEMGKAGYRLLREHTFLPRQYFLEFVPSTP